MKRGYIHVKSMRGLLHLQGQQGNKILPLPLCSRLDATNCRDHREGEHFLLPFKAGAGQYPNRKKDDRDGETVASVPGRHLRILRRCSRVRPGASGSCSHSSCFVRGFLAAALRLALRPSSASMSAHRRTAFGLHTLTSPKSLSNSLSKLGNRYAPNASLPDPWHAPGNNDHPTAMSHAIAWVGKLK